MERLRASWVEGCVCGCGCSPMEEALGVAAILQGGGTLCCSAFPPWRQQFLMHTTGALPTDAGLVGKLGHAVHPVVVKRLPLWHVHLCVVGGPGSGRGGKECSSGGPGECAGEGRQALEGCYSCSICMHTLPQPVLSQQVVVSRADPQSQQGRVKVGRCLAAARPTPRFACPQNPEPDSRHVSDLCSFTAGKRAGKQARATATGTRQCKGGHAQLAHLYTGPCAGLSPLAGRPGSTSVT